MQRRDSATSPIRRARHREISGDQAGLLTLHQPGGDRQFPGFGELYFKNPAPCHYLLRTLRTLRTPACGCPAHMAPQQQVGFPPTREYDPHEIPQEPGVAPEETDMLA